MFPPPPRPHKHTSTHAHLLTHIRQHRHVHTNACSRAHKRVPCIPKHTHSLRGRWPLNLQGGAQATSTVVVVDAFSVPKISYDPVGRKMFADPQPRHLFAGAEVGAGSRLQPMVALPALHQSVSVRARMLAVRLVCAPLLASMCPVQAPLPALCPVLGTTASAVPWGLMCLLCL